MFGITGIVDIHGQRPISEALIQRITDTIAHRGPDGDGYHMAPGVALGHRRLAVIDLQTGDQPIYGADGQTVLIFNGEIYNYRDLRRELESAGYRFQTNSDTEVIVHGWEHWGRQCVTRLRGMFAFALYDARTKSLFLARDRMGKKPLYYTFLPDGYLVFGSELKAILADSRVPRKLNPHAVDDYFAYGYVLDPETIYDGIWKLPPAATLVQQCGRPPAAPVRYWTLPSRERCIATMKPHWLYR